MHKDEDAATLHTPPMQAPAQVREKKNEQVHGTRIYDEG